MRLLFVSPFLPYPPYNGGRTRFLAFIESLIQKHEITIVSFHKLADQRCSYWYKDRGINVETALRPHPLSAKGVMRILNEKSAYIGTYKSLDFQASVKSLLERSRFDLIHVMCSYMLPNLPNDRNRRTPLVIEEPNLEATVLQQYATIVGIPLKWLLLHEATCLETLQKAAAKLADRYICSSPTDAELACSWANDYQKIRMVPNGVDTIRFHTGISAKSFTPLIVYLGNFNYFPNIDAIQLFVRTVFPSVRKRVPGIRLKIAGYRARDKLARLESQDVIVQDYKPDIRADLAEAWISICPVRSGSGSRVKILESMAVGTPVVSSAVGVRGLPVQDRHHVLIASSASMADAIIELIESPDLRSTLSSNARQLVETRMTWTHALDELERVYNEIV